MSFFEFAACRSENYSRCRDADSHVSVGAIRDRQREGGVNLFTTEPIVVVLIPFLPAKRWDKKENYTFWNFKRTCNGWMMAFGACMTDVSLPPTRMTLFFGNVECVCVTVGVTLCITDAWFAWITDDICGKKWSKMMNLFVHVANKEKEHSKSDLGKNNDTRAVGKRWKKNIHTDVKVTEFILDGVEYEVVSVLVLLFSSLITSIICNEPKYAKISLCCE